MRLIPHDYEEGTKKWQEVINEKLFMRPVYIKEQQSIEYSRVAKQFLGIHTTEYDMQEYLYTLTNSDLHWTLLFENLPKQIDAVKRTEIVNILQMHREQPISLNRFMAFFAGKQLLPLMDTKYRNHFVNTLKQWLEQLEIRYPKLKSNSLQRIFLDFVKWSNYFFPKWLGERDFENAVPRVLWYGPAKESEALFLQFLYLFGCDVVIFEPDGVDVLKEHGISGFPTETLPETTTLFDFPFDKPVMVQTITSQAAEQVQQHLYNNAALNFPWKYAEYETRSRILNTTYDELFILSNAELYLREGFGDEGKIVYLPVLFTKIEGISEDEQDYANKIQRLARRDFTQILTKYPILPYQKSNMQFHMRDASVNGQLVAEKIVELSIWPFKNMSVSAQLNMARTLIRLIESDTVLPEPGQSKEAHQQYLFGQIMLAPMDIMRLYQQFDYSFMNPTVAIFKEENSGEMQKQDAVLLAYLSMLGFDVLLFSPAASLSIERFLKQGLLNTLRLEKVSFDVTFEQLQASKELKEEPNLKDSLLSVVRRFSKKRK